MSRTKVVVIDMQPITPAVGGGRQRLLGLFHALGPEVDAVYVGTYDWRGESRRDEQITPGLREICVPLSEAHHAAADSLASEVGKVVIDAAFSWQAALSPEWVEEARRWIAQADVVVFEHPWAFSPLKQYIEPAQLLVYDAQNVESFLKAESIGMEGSAKAVIEEVARNEYELLVAADLVVCCSEQDAGQFSRIFEVPESKMRLAPNGAFTRGGAITTRRESASHPATHGRRLAVFMGSPYGPNVDAARFIVTELAPARPEIDFVLVGGISEALQGVPIPENVTMTGVLSSAERDSWLLRADVALNPMDAGSGTNVKMFDYLAAGLPVLTTAIGARGICDASNAPRFLRIASLDQFASGLDGLLRDAAGDELHEEAWKFVDRRFSWERISAGLGRLIVSSQRRKAAGFRDEARRILLVSTWNIRCGIGEHASYLAEAFRDAGHDVMVFANHLAGHEPIGFDLDLSFPVIRGWTWDNRTWCDSRLDQDAFRRVLRRFEPDHVVVQHHTAYMPPHDYVTAVRVAAEAGAKVTVEAHDGRNLPADAAANLIAAGATVVVHDESERVELASKTGGNVEVIPLPVYASETGAQVDAGCDPAHPVISGFGFLRPYKGVHLAIEALALVRRKFPGASYRGWHALYPDEESERYYDKCMELVRSLGLEDAVSMNTEYQPIEDVVAGLSAATLVLLPYEPSREGASAAANIALAAGRPLVVSRSEIFKPLADTCVVVASHRLRDYASAVVSLLEDPGRLKSYSDRAARRASELSYSSAVGKMLAAP
jgi:glycosyltransferase involved in cell wall biosynthesis